MHTIKIEIPDDSWGDIERYADRLREMLLLGLQQLKVNEALLLYERGVVSFARAAELAGLEREQMIRHARAAGVEPLWSEQMVADELG